MVGLLGMWNTYLRAMVMTVFFFQSYSVLRCSCAKGAELGENDKGVKGSIQLYDCCVNRAMSYGKIWEGRHSEKVVGPVDWKSSLPQWIKELLGSRISGLEQEGLIVSERLEIKILEVGWLLEMTD